MRIIKRQDLFSAILDLTQTIDPPAFLVRPNSYGGNEWY